MPSRVENAAEIERAFESVARVPGGGLVVAPDQTMLRNRNLIIALAARHGCPRSIRNGFTSRPAACMSYGIADIVEPFRQAAGYIDRILRGEKPADLPVQAPTKYSSWSSIAQTAKVLGLTVPSGLLARPMR